MKMNEKKVALFLKILLMISCGSLVVLTTPAWFQGFFAAAVVCLLLAGAVWKLSAIPLLFRQMLTQPWCIAASMVIAAAYGCNFYNMWLDSSYMLRIAGMLNVNVNAIVLFLSIVIGAMAVPCIACVVSYGITVGIEDYSRKKAMSCPDAKKGSLSFGKAFLLLLIVFVLGISAIMRANFLYQDDAGRAAFGYKQWDYFSRFLSTAMATIVHGGDYLVDVAPLPQLLAMAVMAFSSVLVLYIVYDRTEFQLWEVLAMVPLGLSPYFLECVSFRFDAPYMAISVLGGVLPLVFRNRSFGVYLLASMLGVLAVCTSYQAATGIFPMLVILLALRMWSRGNSVKDTVLFCLKSVSGYGLGLLYFKMVLMRPADAGYVSNALPSAAELLPNTIQNLHRYYSHILTDFKPLWLLLVAMLILGFLFATVSTSSRKHIAVAALSFLALGMMLLLCFGIYPVLQDTLFAPRAMYGFGMLLALMGIVCTEGLQRVPLKFAALALSWVFFVFSFAYGNALNYQREYTDYRMELVLSDLNDLEVFRSGEPVTLQISGSIGQAPVIENMPQDFQMLNRLIPETFSGVDDLTLSRFFYYYDLRNTALDTGTELAERNLPVILDTMYHTILAQDDQVLVVLK